MTFGVFSDAPKPAHSRRIRGMVEGNCCSSKVPGTGRMRITDEMGCAVVGFRHYRYLGYKLYLEFYK